MGADKQAIWAAAYSKLVICVSLSAAASAEAPVAPIWFTPSLRTSGRAGMWRESSVCQRALTERRTLGVGSALQRGHRAPLEPLTQRNDALSGGNEPVRHVVPTNVVIVQTAQRGRVRVNGH